MGGSGGEKKGEVIMSGPIFCEASKLPLLSGIGEMSMSFYLNVDLGFVECGRCGFYMYVWDV